MDFIYSLVFWLCRAFLAAHTRLSPGTARGLLVVECGLQAHARGGQWAAPRLLRSFRTGDRARVPGIGLLVKSPGCFESQNQKRRNGARPARASQGRTRGCREEGSLAAPVGPELLEFTNPLPLSAMEVCSLHGTTRKEHVYIYPQSSSHPGLCRLCSGVPVPVGPETPHRGASPARLGRLPPWGAGASWLRAGSAPQMHLGPPWLPQFPFLPSVLLPRGRGSGQEGTVGIWGCSESQPVRGQRAWGCLEEVPFAPRVQGSHLKASAAQAILRSVAPSVQFSWSVVSYSL